MRRPVRLHIKATESSSAATIDNEKMTAVAISIVQAAYGLKENVVGCDVKSTRIPMQETPALAQI